MAETAIRIAVLGAESTGKTTLAAALATRLAQDTGLRVAWVPEWLRLWCDENGRTPRQDEQLAIGLAQHARIEAAAATHDIVVCDTTALMTAVYSRIVFGDRSLEEQAATLHRRMDMTLLTALDLPWVADGVQRDGPQVRGPVDSAVRELLAAHGLAWSVVGGRGAARVAQAMDAVLPWLRERGRHCTARLPGG
jgi:nicotinamide riboside kinase